jgi:hypothetical protein
MTAIDRPALLWRRSSACNSSECVEVALTGERVLVRDSTAPLGSILEFSQREWRAFVLGVRQGTFALGGPERPGQ